MAHTSIGKSKVSTLTKHLGPDWGDLQITTLSYGLSRTDRDNLVTLLMRQAGARTEQGTT